jgi:hypothetical protein
MMEEEKKNEEVLKQVQDDNIEEEEQSETEEMEDEELFSDDEEFGEEQGETWEQIKIWFQDNLRVILSVLIVALIAVGIYNYSKKPQDQGQQLAGEQGIEVQQQEGEQANQNQNEQPQTGVQVQNENDNKGQVVVKGEQQKDQTVTPPKQEQPKVQTPVEKTAEGFVAKADRGEGVTNLARKALKDYLGANADASLTKEHKIYIEDYLRKHVGQGSLKIGDSRAFSESLLKDAIAQSKQLNERQLKNLQKYSARVSNL